MSAYHLNLPILPLNNIERFSFQKCLLPRDKFPRHYHSGILVKCVLKTGDDSDTDEKKFFICRIYPRDDINCCILDTCVSSHRLDINTQILDHVELLETEEVERVSLSYILTAEFFKNKNANLHMLLEISKFELHCLKVSVGCWVQNKYLQGLGVVAIKIVECNHYDPTACFIIDEETNLFLVDVHIEHSKSIEKMNYYDFVHETAMKNLEELHQISQNKHRPKGLALNALIIGASGIGKSTLVAEFIKRTNCNCFTITTSKVLSQYAGETEVALRAEFEAAKSFDSQLLSSCSTVILLEELHLLCPAVKSSATDATDAMRISTQLLKLIDDLRVTNPNIICIATTHSPEALNEQARRAGRFDHEITLDTPTQSERADIFEAIFKEQLPKYELSQHILDDVAKQTQGYVISDLFLLLNNIVQSIYIGGADSLGEVISEKLKHMQPSAIRNTDVQVYKPNEGFEKIGGMQALKNVLRVSVLAGLNQRDAFKRFGLSIPKGLLFYGPPGCAKTTFAKCLAKEANMTFIATSGAEVYSPYVGCAEKFIARLFDTARKNAPCLIFLDEIDSLVGRRALSSSTDSNDIQLRILATLLTEMDGIVSNNNVQHILVVAATNRPDMVDDALMRPGRFDKLIHVPAPDFESRLALLQLHEKRMPFASDVNLEHIAKSTEQYAGADICNLCNEAALNALQRDRDVTEIRNEDFKMVLKKLKSSLTTEQITSYKEFKLKFLNRIKQ